MRTMVKAFSTASSRSLPVCVVPLRKISLNSSSDLANSSDTVMPSALARLRKIELKSKRLTGTLTFALWPLEATAANCKS